MGAGEVLVPAPKWKLCDHPAAPFAASPNHLRTCRPVSSTAQGRQRRAASLSHSRLLQVPAGTRCVPCKSNLGETKGDTVPGDVPPPLLQTPWVRWQLHAPLALKCMKSLIKA